MRLIFPISLLIISGLLLALVANPFYGDVKKLKAEVSTYNLALNNSTELQKTRDSLVEKYKNIKKEDKDRLDHFLPSTINNIELILEIEKIANLHGMPVRNIKFDSMNADGKDTKKQEPNTVAAEAKPEEYLPYGIFPMEFVVEGNYSNFTSFLTDLERNLRLVDVKSISFNVPQAQSSTSTTPGVTFNPNLYSYTLQVEAYWLK